MSMLFERHGKVGLAAATLAIAVGLASPAPAQVPGRGDAVMHWNAIALQAVADDHSGTWHATDDGHPDPEQGGPTRTSRALAIVHLAIYDAVIGIDGSYAPYLPLGLPASTVRGASTRAAVAQAAHDTLVALYPSQADVFHRHLERIIDRIPPSPSRANGLTVGATAAANILAARQRDGSERHWPYTPGTDPGEHREDPLNPHQGFLGVGWGKVRTFSGIDVRAPEVMAAPPPPLNSAEYAANLQEVRDMGGDGVTTPSVRTEEQTEIGIFWAYDGTIGLGPPPRMYNQAVHVIARRMNNSLVQNARLFALVNLAQADTGIAVWESKYRYNLWRPIVGIREAASDGNPQTKGDPHWKPLGAPASNESGKDFTPPFPAYPSGHAGFGATVFRVLELFYGTDEMRFRLTSDELNGHTTDWAGVPRYETARHFERFSDAARENADSRIYLGIHWRIDAESGLQQGSSVADYVFANVLR